MTSIQDLANSWLSIDRDPTTRAEISTLLSTNNTTELSLRLHGRISFGTAGLRARMEAGFTRMNSVTVIQASQGLASYILQEAPTNQISLKSQGIVIGHDARHNSEKYARLAAAAFLGKGFKVWWFGRNVHTPLVPFAVSERGAAAGVMVTASHNPARDNGYKVYWLNGCQIIPPHDRGIAAAIERNLEPLCWDEELPLDDPEVVEDIFVSTEAAYYERVKELVNLPSDATFPPFVYTPMHGVGLPFLTNAIHHITNTSPPSTALTSSRSNLFITVPSQANPDPNFPTVRFPNPEEAGSLDLAISTADMHSIPLIIATDPDADRLAVAEKLSSTGKWHQYTGNQVGVLLASYILDIYKTKIRQQSPHGEEENGAKKEMETLCVLASTVSSSMLRTMASVEGFHFVETLTGFKWLGNVAQQLSHPPSLQPNQQQKRNYAVPFAYEEALGYMFPSVVSDKDGISAALVFLSAVSHWSSNSNSNSNSQRPCTPWDRLQQLYKRYGYFADANTYLISPSPAVTDAVFAAIRAIPPLIHERKDSKSKTPPPHPTHLSPDLRILRWRDLTTGYDSSTPNHVPELPVDPGSQMITCDVGAEGDFGANNGDFGANNGDLGANNNDFAAESSNNGGAGKVEGDIRFTIRGSGTEPKIKLYIEARSTISMDEARSRALRVRDVLVAKWFRPGDWGLVVAGG